jgi:hypothetical protein
MSDILRRHPVDPVEQGQSTGPMPDRQQLAVGVAERAAIVRERGGTSRLIPIKRQADRASTMTKRRL